MGEDSVMDGEGVVKDQDGGGVLEKLQGDWKRIPTCPERGEDG